VYLQKEGKNGIKTILLKFENFFNFQKNKR